MPGIELPPDLEAQLVRLAEASGLSPAECFAEAVKRFLQTDASTLGMQPRPLSVPEQERALGQVREIMNNLGRLPIQDVRHPNDILYDQHGLPL
jgi:hypothetical protein